MRKLLTLLMLSASLLVLSCTSLTKAQSAATKLDSAAGDVAIAAKVVKDAATSFKAPPPNPDGSTNIGAWLTGLLSAGVSAYGAWKAAKGLAARANAPVLNAFHATVDTIDSMPDDAAFTKADLLAKNAAHPLMGPGARVAVAQAQSR